MTGEVQEFDFSEVPDLEASKNYLWHEAVDEFAQLIGKYPEAMLKFVLFYLKYSILGHPRFGRLFIRVARKSFSNNIVVAVDSMQRSGYIYDGKSTSRASQAEAESGSED